MCRAVWVVILARDDAAGKRLRRAAGIECQVVAMATSSHGAGEILADRTVDAVVIDGEMERASDEVAAVRVRAPHAAIVWVGESAPAGVDCAVGWINELDDVVPSAITKALLARKHASG